MPLFAQVDGTLVTALLDTHTAPTVLPKGRTFVPLATAIELLSTYDAATAVFTPPLPSVPQPSALEAKLEEILTEVKKTSDTKPVP